MFPAAGTQPKIWPFFLQANLHHFTYSSFPLSDVCAIIVCIATLRSKNCSSVLLENSLNLFILSFVGWLHLIESSFQSARTAFTSLILIMIYIVWVLFWFTISSKSKIKYIKLASWKKRRRFPLSKIFCCDTRVHTLGFPINVSLSTDVTLSHLVSSPQQSYEMELRTQKKFAIF